MPDEVKQQNRNHIIGNCYAGVRNHMQEQNIFPPRKTMAVRHKIIGFEKIYGIVHLKSPTAAWSIKDVYFTNNQFAFYISLFYLPFVKLFFLKREKDMKLSPLIIVLLILLLLGGGGFGYYSGGAMGLGYGGGGGLLLIIIIILLIR